MVFVMGIIFFLSHQSGESLALPSFPGADKLAHMTAYAVLAFTVIWSFGRRGLDNSGRTVFLVVLFCLFYGMTDEYHQSFIASRSVSAYDVLADMGGAFFCSILWMKSLVLQEGILVCQKRLLAVTQLIFFHKT